MLVDVASGRVVRVSVAGHPPSAKSVDVVAVARVVVAFATIARTATAIACCLSGSTGAATSSSRFGWPISRASIYLAGADARSAGEERRRREQYQQMGRSRNGRCEGWAEDCGQAQTLRQISWAKP